MNNPNPTFIKTSQGFINLALVALVVYRKDNLIIKLSCQGNGQGTNIWLEGEESQAFVAEIERYTISLTNR